MNAEHALDIAHRVARIVVGSVGQAVGGIILHGSLASGDYEPERSDIDLLVVLEEALEPTATHVIFNALTELLAPTPTAIDLRFTSRATSAAPPRLPMIDLELAAHPPDNVLQVIANAPDSDLLNEFAICRAYGRSLYGRDALDMIGPVSNEWLLEIADEQLATWQRVHATGRVGTIVPLTASRIWRFAAEGDYCSKHEAARWVLERAPDCDVVAQAIRAHEGERDADLDARLLTVLLALARGAVAEAIAASPNVTTRR